MSKLNLDKTKKYLLACSYGPDSMALFDMLLKEGYDFEVAHVNYHLRKESDSETEGLTNFCFERNIKLHVLDYEREITGNIESECREIRYDYFKNALENSECKEVLVAHNEDDLLETYLMQIDRKIDPIFYGIKEFTTIKGVPIRRPLLDWSKAELQEYCDTNNVPYAIDQSNFDTRYKRNEIRANKVSKMSGEERRMLREFINEKNKQLQSIFNKFKKADLNKCAYILSLDDLGRIYAVNLVYQTACPGEYLSRENVGEILKVLNSPKPNVASPIKNDTYLVKNYDSYTFCLEEPTFDSFLFKIDEPGIYDNNYFYFNCGSYDIPTRHISKDDFPLTIRNLNKEDIVDIAGYQVKANRLFIDWKMPTKLRGRWPCILNKKGKIIYVPRYQKDFKPNKETDFYVKVD